MKSCLFIAIASVLGLAAYFTHSALPAASTTSASLSRMVPASHFSLIAPQKSYAFTILLCQYVCEDAQGCECQCNGQDYNLSQGFACQ